MVLRKVGACAPILLEACAETLETLRFYVADDPGRSLLPAHKIDLSRLKALRSLEIGVWVSEFGPTDSRHTITTEVFSTITSPVFSELIFVVWYSQFPHLLLDATLFETLRTMNLVRPFKLAFLVQVPHSSSTEGRRKFEAALATVIARGLLDFLESPPTIRIVQPYPLVKPYP